MEGSNPLVDPTLMNVTLDNYSFTHFSTALTL